MLKKIVVPIDGTEYSKEAVIYAKALAEAFNSEIYLINVMGDWDAEYSINPYTFSQGLIEKMRQENVEISDKILTAAKNDLGDSKVKVSTVQKVGLAPEEIIRFAEEIDADLIVIGSKGTNGIRNMMGSVARKVAIKSDKPVFIVK